MRRSGYICRSVPSAQVKAADSHAVECSLLHELNIAFFDDRYEGARRVIVSLVAGTDKFTDQLVRTDSRTNDIRVDPP